MTNKVAIIGVGIEGFRSSIRELSYKEMVYQAAVKAYSDAQVNPRDDVDTFISCEEDFNMGTSITDEYAPDQIGGAQRPVHTITGDGIQGMAAAYMQIKTGMFDIAVVEAQSRASDILTHNQIQHFALDPLYVRQFDATHHTAAALEKQIYLKRSNTSEDAVAEVAVKNHNNALFNPNAAYGIKATKQDILQSKMIATPLRSGEVSESADGAVVIVLASEKGIGNRDVDPVWINGISYATNSPNFHTRDWQTAKYAELCAKKAYEMASITNPKSQIDVFEIDDTYAFKELQHLEALGIYESGEAGKALLNGELGRKGSNPVNTSGGTIGMGNGHDVNGLQRVAEVVHQLRGHAGKRQISGAKTGLAFSWRGVPTTAGAIAVLGGN
ncbi:MAG: acetyl-CoA acetyltransferase [Candidatus Heimdallarchaeota archaeon]|nr:acetyl-CoA acetyltransferase [Candidatus Heimdallarchaeota archaeon]MDH5646292.1 acetyl-CoA acetyltransferase [Candidatus Heimdallarchaeota archaeon]